MASDQISKNVVKTFTVRGFHTEYGTYNAAATNHLRLYLLNCTVHEH